MEVIDMLTLEEYLLKRREKEDVDIYNLKYKQENMKKCIDFVFEYFNEYLDQDIVDRSFSKEGKKMQKYRERVKDYSEEVQSWLINMYKEYKTYIDVILINYIKKDQLFKIYSTGAEFSKLSYNCFSEVSKKYKWLENYIPQMNAFIRDYHRLQIAESYCDIDKYNIPRLSKWVKNTNKKYNVNLINFAHDYASDFFSMKTKWDRSIQQYYDVGVTYESYDIVNSKNKFDIKGLFMKCSYMPFMKNRKRDLELLIFLMYDEDIASVPKDYKKKYLESMQVDVEKN